MVYLHIYTPWSYRVVEFDSDLEAQRYAKDHELDCYDIDSEEDYYGVFG